MKHKLITLLSLSIIILFIFTSGCKKDTVTEPAKDTEKPTVSILFPGSGSDVKADTIYTVIADANDNTKVTKVEFYINGLSVGSDTLSPYEYRWSTQGLSTTQTIMAKAFDEAGNIGTSIVISVSIKGVANHAPATPTNPSPADSSAGQLLNPTLRWSCSDPDGDALTYDVFFSTSNPPTQVATGQSATTLARTGLSISTTYYWKVNAKDSKGATTSGIVWSFTTTATAALTANPASVSVAVGSTATATISGGSTPYSIQTVPNSSVATATLNGATLSVTGVAAGSTSVTVKDNSSPAKTVTVSITVTTSGGGFTTAGTLSFTSNKGNFSANGIYSPNATTGSGAGAMLEGSGQSNFLMLYGFRVNSATSIDVAVIEFMDSSPIATGSFNYPPTTGSKLVMISYYPAMNPSDTTNESLYLMSTATATISAFTSSNAQGTFSGNGMLYLNGTPNSSQTIAITGGSFNVPVIAGSGGVAKQANSKIESIVRRIVNSNKR